jgi:hypothetical protein
MFDQCCSHCMYFRLLVLIRLGSALVQNHKCCTSLLVVCKMSRSIQRSYDSHLGSLFTQILKLSYTVAFIMVLRLAAIRKLVYSSQQARSLITKLFERLD